MALLAAIPAIMTIVSATSTAAEVAVASATLATSLVSTGLSAAGMATGNRALSIAGGVTGLATGAMGAFGGAAGAGGGAGAGAAGGGAAGGGAAQAGAQTGQIVAQTGQTVAQTGQTVAQTGAATAAGESVRLASSATAAELFPKITEQTIGTASSLEAGKAAQGGFLAAMKTASPYISSGLDVLSGAAQTVQTIRQGQLADAQAKAIERQTKITERRQINSDLAVIGKQRALFAGRGLDTSGGTPLAVMSDSVRSLEMNAHEVNRTGMMKAYERQGQAMGYYDQIPGVMLRTGQSVLGTFMQRRY
jgi:hypothetical protein